MLNYLKTMGGMQWGDTKNIGLPAALSVSWWYVHHELACQASQNVSDNCDYVFGTWAGALADWSQTKRADLGKDINSPCRRIKLSCVLYGAQYQLFALEGPYLDEKALRIVVAFSRSMPLVSCAYFRDGF